MFSVYHTGATGLLDLGKKRSHISNLCVCEGTSLHWRLNLTFTESTVKDFRGRRMRFFKCFLSSHHLAPWKLHSSLLLINPLYKVCCTSYPRPAIIEFTDNQQLKTVSPFFPLSVTCHLPTSTTTSEHQYWIGRPDSAAPITVWAEHQLVLV